MVGNTRRPQISQFNYRYNLISHTSVHVILDSSLLLSKKIILRLLVNMRRPILVLLIYFIGVVHKTNGKTFAVCELMTELLQQGFPEDQLSDCKFHSI